ncbi:MAG TPA: ABC-F family ATP-binding cassette domain-containing protein [Candidatus Saccharimonadia bacterium]|nr:ABC-F family ATP-binding cassette domain-containing protein [Candidatus Saccharimonadia bacterium]
MLINLQNIGKTIGAKTLYANLDLTIQAGEKIGLIGRNGIGKTTLLGIMDGTDSSFTGSLETRRGLVVASTAQEHHAVADQPVLEYVLENLPEYKQLKHIIDAYPETMGEDMAMISAYSDALSRFGELGYYDIEQRARQELEDFQLPAARIDGPMRTLSGGQKRFVELVKVTLADADLALIDEPTNHMDYIAKEAFIEWLEAAKQAVVVITHDRDVLAVVDRIVEIKDKGTVSFDGDYENYLKQNGRTTMNAMEQYEFDQRTLSNLHNQVMEARRKKNKAAGPSAVRFRIMEDRLARQYSELKSRIVKPSFWIDSEQLDTMQNKMVEKYDKYKAKNIRIHTKEITEGQRVLVDVENLSLGYDQPLFAGINLHLRQGERIELKGRNGVGKSTFVKAILSTAGSTKLGSQIFGGHIILDPKIKIGVYEQEIDAKYLSMPLGQAVMNTYLEQDVPASDQKVRQILSDYLFDPQLDAQLPIERLSGGQKARFQLIKMLCAGPNLLILDEPTNHLDLPSIEELEKALDRYTGAVLYISHDSYFTRGVGGEVIEVAP